MPSASKRKGNAFERELVNSAIESGIPAKRAYASNGESLGLHAEVDCVVGTKRVQAKRRRHVADFMQPSENVDAVAIRQDRGETLVVITWWEWLDLLKLAVLEARHAELVESVTDLIEGRDWPKKKLERVRKSLENDDE